MKLFTNQLMQMLVHCLVRCDNAPNIFFITITLNINQINIHFSYRTPLFIFNIFNSEKHYLPLQKEL